ncbi:MAG: ABC transporter ATP-binding protein [Kiloniellales bacterium]|nr:ABC transporter ATP-binding protein [Kiloniellales bacterium]
MSAPAAARAPGEPLLELRGLTRHFRLKEGLTGQRTAVALDGVDLTLRRGAAYGLVGESGSGKTTVARLILRLLQPTSGQILFAGQDITGLKGEALMKLRERIQIVFQDPHASLNPRQTILFSVAEPLVIHRGLRGPALRRRVEELLETVGLPGGFLYRYPHELSGGQKQRACIARAVALNPELLVLDEPTSALDVSVQAQVLEFLRDLKARLDLTYLFISHDLSVVRYLCDRVAVMYMGKVVEEGAVGAVFESPSHPYTESLLSAVPLPQARQPEGRIVLSGDVPSATAIPRGCAFHPRCPRRIGAVCETAVPRLDPRFQDHAVACHLYGSGS